MKNKIRIAKENGTLQTCDCCCDDQLLDDDMINCDNNHRFLPVSLTNSFHLNIFLIEHVYEIISKMVLFQMVSVFLHV